MSDPAPTLTAAEFAVRVAKPDVEAYGDTTTRELRTFDDGSEAVAVLVTLALVDGTYAEVWRLVPVGIWSDA